VAEAAETGINFLQERAQFWDSLGPLPPPRPTRKSVARSRNRSQMSQYTSTESLNTISSFKTGMAYFLIQSAVKPAYKELIGTMKICLFICKDWGLKISSLQPEVSDKRIPYKRTYDTVSSFLLYIRSHTFPPV